MQTTIWATIIAGTLAGGFALIGTLIGARHRRSDWLREQRVEAATEVMKKMNLLVAQGVRWWSLPGSTADTGDATKRQLEEKLAAAQDIIEEIVAFGSSGAAARFQILFPEEVSKRLDDFTGAALPVIRGPASPSADERAAFHDTKAALVEAVRRTLK